MKSYSVLTSFLQVITTSEFLLGTSLQLFFAQRRVYWYNGFLTGCFQQCLFQCLFVPVFPLTPILLLGSKSRIHLFWKDLTEKDSECHSDSKSPAAIVPISVLPFQHSNRVFEVIPPAHRIRGSSTPALHIWS